MFRKILTGLFAALLILGALARHSAANGARQVTSPIIVVSAQRTASNIAGIWVGRLAARGRTLRVVIKVKPGTDGQLAATLDSSDQGLQDLPLQDVTFNDQILTFDFRVGGARYRGRLIGDRFEGESALPGAGNQWRVGSGDEPAAEFARDSTGAP
jgi:hypothetical protein